MNSGQNELFDFIVGETNALLNEYERVQRRVREDPGTAGDQGEENWASILRKWLPKEYYVVTKGRILGHNGVASPQVDLIILHPSYPPSLRDKKLYLAGGVAAAFECKLTLEAAHIAKTTENCVEIKRLTLRRTGTPYVELNSPMLYGLLAHSHSWQRERSTPLENVTRTIDDKDQETARHPREILDIVCVLSKRVSKLGGQVHDSILSPCSAKPGAPGSISYGTFSTHLDAQACMGRSKAEEVS
jgi:hypothetical protein